MSKILTQIDLETKLVSDSISNSLRNFISQKKPELANAKKVKGNACEHFPVSFLASFQLKINVYGLPDVEDRRLVC